VLDAVNRTNAGYPFANLMVDTVSGSNVLLTEAHVFVESHRVEAARLREVLELSLELAEFALPPFALSSRNTRHPRGLTPVG